MDSQEHRYTGDVLGMRWIFITTLHWWPGMILLRYGLSRASLHRRLSPLGGHNVTSPTQRPVAASVASHPPPATGPILSHAVRKSLNLFWQGLASKFLTHLGLHPWLLKPWKRGLKKNNVTTNKCLVWFLKHSGFHGWFLSLFIWKLPN